MCFHEKQQVEQEGWDNSSEWRPHRYRFIVTQGWNQPSSFGGISHLQARGNVQFLSVGVVDQEIEQNHDDNGDRNSKIT